MSLYAVQALSLYNDHTFKQVVLLLLVDRATEAGDWQGLALGLFALPFLLFATSAGRWADHADRRQILIVSKYCEWAVMVAAAWLLLTPQTAPTAWLLGLLFMMATQSAYLSPAKYAIILDLFPADQVTRVNATMQMLGYGAIVAGSATGGWLVTHGSEQPWVYGGLLVGTAFLGIGAAHMVPKSHQSGHADSALSHRSKLGRHRGLPDPPHEPWAAWRVVRRDRLLRDMLLVFGSLWLVAGLYQPIVNSIGRTQLGLTAQATSWILSLSVIGIALGCYVRSRMTSVGVANDGLKGLVLGLLGLQLLLAVPPMLGLPLTAILLAGVLLACGILIGMLVLPLHVGIQTRAPAELRGRVLAAQNVVNWMAIILAGATYQMFRLAADRFELPPSSMFLPLAGATAAAWWMLRPGPERLLRGHA